MSFLIALSLLSLNTIVSSSRNNAHSKCSGPSDFVPGLTRAHGTAKHSLNIKWDVQGLRWFLKFLPDTLAPWESLLINARLPIFSSPSLEPNTTWWFSDEGAYRQAFIILATKTSSLFKAACAKEILVLSLLTVPELVDPSRDGVLWPSLAHLNLPLIKAHIRINHKLGSQFRRPVRSLIILLKSLKCYSYWANLFFNLLPP